MTLDEAKAIIGRTNACEPYLSNKIKAPSMFSGTLNTPEESDRLAAACIVRAAQRKQARK